MLFPGRLAVALETQGLKADETEFFEGTDGLLVIRNGRANARPDQAHIWAVIWSARGSREGDFSGCVLKSLWRGETAVLAVVGGTLPPRRPPLGAE